MEKEKRYQGAAQAFIERQFEAYNGFRVPIYTEEFARAHDASLQSLGVVPFIGDTRKTPELLGRYQLKGLAQKIAEINRVAVEAFAKKHKLTLSLHDIAEALAADFIRRYQTAAGEHEQYTLIFSLDHEVTQDKLRRAASIPGATEPLAYNVVYFEKPGEWSGKNDVRVIRERRLPVPGSTRTQRPDFLVYLNGIPLLLIEYKTEDSGVSAALKDFEEKETYRCVPFKVAVNDGSTLLFFSNIESLKHASGRNNHFEWAHYDQTNRKVHDDGREYSNAEYFFDELLCQPQNLFDYCLNGCTPVTDGAQSYLVNARIQQYFALKAVAAPLLNAKRGTLPLPFNFLFAHAQRSGKTITMKLLCYYIARHYLELYNTVFLYTPDLQIKDVLAKEFARQGLSKARAQVINTRAEYIEAVRASQDADGASGLRVFIVNMQKLGDKLVTLGLRVTSKRVLNILDEAHYGQAKELAELRDKVFPNASTFLFTATGKEAMYAYYFPDNNAEGFRNRFTISDAKRCNITVPVHFAQAEKQCYIGETVRTFATELERRLGQKRSREARIFGIDETEVYGLLPSSRVAAGVARVLDEDLMPVKLDYVCAFLDELKQTLTFSPKAVIYVSSVAEAKQYIGHIQALCANNVYKGYNFGTDFSGLTPETCEELNPGIDDPRGIEQAFLRRRDPGAKAPCIDVLIAVDKYQKGFDLPELMATFLDTTIREVARMNQIYTRAATKHPGKALGHCVDLTLDPTNAETFSLSMATYDSADASECFINDALIAEVNTRLYAEFLHLDRALDLDERSFTANLILQKVLNEPDLAVREERQTKFFNITCGIFGALRKIGSPLYYRPFALRLRALIEAFETFKDIYADTGHPERHKVLIDMDRSFRDGTHLTTAEIRSVIHEVLRFVKAASLSDLLQFSFVPNKGTVVDPSADRELILKRAQADRRAQDLDKDFEGFKDLLAAMDKPLFDFIQQLLGSIASNRYLAYEEGTQAAVAEATSKLEALRQELRKRITEDFGGSSLRYWLQEKLAERLRVEDVVLPGFVAYVACTLELKLKVPLSLLDESLSVHDKVVSLKNELLKSAGEKLPAMLHGYSEADRGFVKSTLLEAKSKADAKGLESMATSKELFEQFLREALRMHYTATV